jgi:hypothetical protein
MTSVLSISALALMKQLEARGISLNLEVCKDIQEAVIEETASVGEDMLKRVREREGA